jgi:restriction system protein
MKKTNHAWMVRAGNDNELAPHVEKEGVVAIGWKEMGDLSNLKRRRQFKDRYREVHPEHAEGRVNVNAGQVHRFTCEIRESHYALTYIKDSRELLIGLIAGPYQYRTDVFDESSRKSIRTSGACSGSNVCHATTSLPRPATRWEAR